MNVFTYEEQENRKYLVYERNEEDRMDTVALEMMSNNRIAGVISPNYIQMDDKFYIKYDITGMISLKEYLQGVVNRTKILSILESIADAAVVSEDYMLRFTSYVLDLDYIYIEPDALRIAMVVLPVVRKEVPIDVFLKELVMGNRYDETEDSSYVVSLINLFGGCGTFSIHMFKEELERLRKANVDTRKPQGKVGIAGARQTQSNPSPHLQLQRQSQNQQIQSQDSQQMLKQQATWPTQQQAFKPQADQPTQQPPDFPAMRLSEDDRKKIVQDLKREHNLEILFSHEDGGEAKKEKKGFFLRKEKAEKEKKPEKEKKLEKKSLWEKLTGGKNQNTDAAMNSPLGGIAIPGMDMQVSNQGTVGKDSLEKKTVKSDIAVPYQNVEMKQRAVDMQDFAETEYFPENDDKETFIMGEEQNGRKPEFILYRHGTGERFPISEEVTRIGRSSFAEIRIVGNDKVSRVHAMLYLQDGEVFIEDNNSKNKTYVNGVQIKPGQSPIKLANGAKIRFGNEELEFCIQ